MTWEEVCAHPSLQNLPFKIETNQWGQVVMSPTKILCSAYKAEIGGLLCEFMKEGEIQEMKEKRELYFENGAKEVWYCDKNGKIIFYNEEGKLKKSALCPDFPDRIKL